MGEDMLDCLKLMQVLTPTYFTDSASETGTVLIHWDKLQTALGTFKYIKVKNTLRRKFLNITQIS